MRGGGIKDEVQASVSARTEEEMRGGLKGIFDWRQDVDSSRNLKLSAVAESGDDLQSLGVCGDLHVSNSLEFLGNSRSKEDMAFPHAPHIEEQIRIIFSIEEMRAPTGAAALEQSAPAQEAPEDSRDEKLSAPVASPVSSVSATPQAASNMRLAGPGFQFARGADGRITIGAIAPGGPANAEGSLVAGDELISVDALNCAQASARDVRAAILGVQGSTVRLQVFRALIKALIKAL
jgi:hypothetical protein